MRPRRRRQVTAEQKVELLQRLAGREDAPDRSTQGERTAPESALVRPVDPKALLRQRALFAVQE